MQFNIIFIFYPFFDPLKNIGTYIILCTLSIYKSTGCCSDSFRKWIFSHPYPVTNLFLVRVCKHYGQFISILLAPMPTTQRYFFHYKTKTVCILIRNISVTVVDYAVDIFWNTARASLLLNETLTHFIAQSCKAQESMTGRYWKLLQYSMTNYIKPSCTLSDPPRYYQVW